MRLELKSDDGKLLQNQRETGGTDKICVVSNELGEKKALKSKFIFVHM